MKITKKFYVGSRSMMPEGSRYNDWAHSTLQAAINHAKMLAEEHETDQIVVQIIRVVKRRQLPLFVEIVR